ncbi:hypothetical protein AXK12_00890 [Cephaloticoccus capnophilus]|uniref:DUF2851 domain-containing protein n=1 Tax=Cephaloticoccus capnophilus TaxID=1548208 RepID=A0A139STN3_9BACT|nr:hypothetical protein AXK12_00890 [Cephaloticoccus capnophilus]
MGTYGPFTFSEKLFQKIWDQGAFDQARLETVDGQRIRIERRGKWNHLGGPDFRHARLRIGEEGRAVEGDIELHLYAGDWAAHGHAADPAYDRVRLHVVLFPPAEGKRTFARDGSEIPTACLLPLLHHDLEEYAAEEAVETLAGRRTDTLAEAIRALAPEALRERLVGLAAQRWAQKLRYAGLRVRRLGFDEACHQTALEVLGFRFNRVPMLNLALRYPLATWAGVDEAELDARFAEQEQAWARAAVRPANQPRRRLAQYARWASACPQWPTRLGELAVGWPVPSMEDDTRALRRGLSRAALRDEISLKICDRAVRGTRLDTLICDGLLPLAALRTGRDFSGLWWHWWAGDLPGFLRNARSDLRSVVTPQCQGAIQALIAWALELEAVSSLRAAADTAASSE